VLLDLLAAAWARVLKCRELKLVARFWCGDFIELDREEV